MRSIGERAVVWAAHAVMALIGVAALAKALGFHSFIVSLSSWDIVPDGLLVVAGAAVIISELLLVALWCIGIPQRRLAFATALMLAFYSGVYAWRVALGDPPECHCLGRLLAFESAQRSSFAVLGRNALLILVLAARASMRDRPRSRTAEGAARGQPPDLRIAGARHAFTLLETLLVIAVIAVLIAITLPTLAQLRNRSWTIQSISNLRQNGAWIIAYTSDWRDTLPQFIRPDGTHDMARGSSRWPNDHPYKERCPYFMHALFWPWIVALSSPEGYAWHFEGFYPPHANRVSASSISDLPYQYAATSVSAPEFWQPETRTGPDQWTAVRVADIRFTSSKVILSARVDAQGGQTEAHLAYADGSAEVRPPKTLLDGYLCGEGLYDGAWSTSSDWPPGSHTISGVRGRDVRSR